jgi:hypothetical protein
MSTTPGEDIYEDDDDDMSSTKSKVRPPPMNAEECRKYGIFCIKESSRNAAVQHKKTTEANIMKRNRQARIEKTQQENRILRERKEEDERLRLLSCIKTANSALHIDQYEKEVERTRRLTESFQKQRLRKKRADIVRGSKQVTPKPIPLKGEATYVGSNPVADVVIPHKVICQMALNNKIISDQLLSTKTHNKALSKLIRREVEDTKKMFPSLASLTWEGAGRALLVRPSSAAAQLSPHRTFQALALDYIDPLSTGKENNNNNNNNNADHCPPGGNNNSNNTHWHTKPLNTTKPQRPQSSPSVRPQRPTSPTLRWLKQSDADKLSTRFDSPGVPITGTRPPLPKIITIPDILPGWVPPPTHLY